jgi:acyl-CoA thioester hydrolase
MSARSQEAAVSRGQFWFFHPFRVRYSEIDGQGVVFNAHYLTYFDTAITEYFRALRYDYMGEVKRTGADFHTVRTVVEYKAPILFDQDIEVGVRTEKLGRTSLSFALAILPKGSEEVLATGEVVWVHTDQTSRRAVPYAEALRGLLADRERIEA